MPKEPMHALYDEDEFQHEIAVARAAAARKAAQERITRERERGEEIDEPPAPTQAVIEARKARVAQIISRIEAGKKNVVAIGIKTDQPDEIVDTPSVRELAKTAPKLFKTLKDEGIAAFNKAIAAEKFVAQQEQKRFKRLNRELPDGRFISKDKFAELKKTNPEAHKALETKGIVAANRVIKRQNIMPLAAPTIQPEEPQKLSLPRVIWEAIINPPKATQASLKRAYEEQQKLPVWARLLFLKADVVRHPKTGRYSELPPLFIFGAGVKGPPTKQITQRQIVKTIEVNWNRLLKPKHKPRIDWGELVEAIRRGSVKDAKDATKWARQHRLEKEAAEAAAREVAKIRAAKEAAVKARWPEVKARWVKSLEEVVDKQPKPLRFATIAEAQQVIANRLTTVAAISKVISDWGEIESKGATKPQLKELNEVQAQAQVALITQLANETAARLAQQAKTQAQIRSAVKVLTQQQIETITDTAVKTQVQEQVKRAIKPTTKVKIIKPSRLRVPPKALKLPSLRIIEPPPIKEPPTRFKVPVKKVLPIRFNRSDDNKRRRDIEHAKGAIAWRQGQLHGKDRWDVVMSPFTQDENYTIVLGHKPTGAILVKGPGSAFKTARSIFGQRLRHKVIVNQPGIFATELAPTGTDAIRLTFKRDVELTQKVGNLEERGRIFPLP